MAKGGMPSHIPTEVTRAKVSALVAFGIPQEHIAINIGVSDETLRKYYREELETGLSNANQQVANVLFSKAVDERDLGACIFWLKTRGRHAFREKDPEDNKDLKSIVEKLIDKMPSAK